MKKQLLFLLLTILSFDVNAQNFQWAKTIGGGNGDDNGKSIAVDATGNVFTTGTFVGTVDFDPGAGVFEMTSSGTDGDIYILKLNSSGGLVWAKDIGGIPASFGEGGAITLDASGNIYTTGYFFKAVDFDPGPGVNILTPTSAGGFNIFVLKLDASGNFVWAKNMGGTGTDQGTSIAVDALGNVYTSGYFKGTCDFDPGAAVYNLIASGSSNSDIFISKLDANGNFVWVQSMGGNEEDRSNGIALDAFGNVYTTGYFQGTVDFDASAATFNLTAGGTADIFILKLSASGNFIWARSLEGIMFMQSNARAITVDATGNIYTTGYFQGTVDFDPGPAVFSLTPVGVAGDGDAYVLKLNSSGELLWAKRMGGGDTDEVYGICLDGLGNIYTTGYFQGTGNFNTSGGVFELVSAGFSDIFVTKLDVNGALVWAKAMGGPNVDYSRAIAVDPIGNVYTTGWYKGISDFDPGIGVYELTSGGFTTIFISKLGVGIVPISLLSFEAAKIENDANLIWKTASESNSYKFDIERSEDGMQFKKIGEVNASGNSSVIKSYFFSDKNAGINFPNQNLFYRIKQSDLDGSHTYYPTRNVKFEQINVNHLHGQVYPNPAKNLITIQVNNYQVCSTYTITDQKGSKVLSGFLNSNTALVNISNLAAGQYFIRFNGNATTKTISFMKQ